MNQSACIADLLHFEKERAAYITRNAGNASGFVSNHGKLLSSHPDVVEPLKAHLAKPSFFGALALSSHNRAGIVDRQALRDAAFDNQEVAQYHIDRARIYVSALLDVDLASVQVITSTHAGNEPEGRGTVYPCGVDEHLVVVPMWSSDPEGMLVRQFAIAAHYCAMRSKGTLGSMVSDVATQEMVGHFAATRYAQECQTPELVTSKQGMLVKWEFAKGMAENPTQPIAFICSDLGCQLIQDYGAQFCQRMIVNLYECMAEGQGITYGAAGFLGYALGIALLDEVEGMRQFIRNDTGVMTLEVKLSQAFDDYSPQRILSFNDRLKVLIG